MKTILYSIIAIALVTTISSCDSVNYRRTQTGLLYKIIPSNSSDSLAKPGNWVKINFTQKLNDSVLQTNYNKMPAYIRIESGRFGNYDPTEILPLVKKGDSAITIVLVDSLLKKGLVSQLPEFMKKGDRIITSFKVLEVFRNDSLYMEDSKIEQAKDISRNQKDMEEQKAKELAEMEKSGEAAKERKEVEDYLTAKNITATKTEKGTYVLVKEQGSGSQVATGKYVEVKYTGKLLATDSIFQSNVYSFKIDEPGGVIDGWNDGLKLFKEGGKGTLYIPGYMAYGKNPGPGSTPNEALIFDVEVVKVSDNP